MNRLVLSMLAEEDLEDIWVNIALGNQLAADRLVDKLNITLGSLAAFPEMGRTADHLRAGARSFVHGHYVIVYRIMDYGVAVLRVVHGARDLEALDFPEAPRDVRDGPVVSPYFDEKPIADPGVGTEPNISAIQWLLSQPSRGTAPKEQMDRELNAERDSWA